MPPLSAKKKPVKANQILQVKLPKENLHTLAEYKKENLRLHKLYTKKIVKLESENNQLRATLAEEKKNRIHVVINNPVKKLNY